MFKQIQKPDENQAVFKGSSLRKEWEKPIISLYEAEIKKKKVNNFNGLIKYTKFLFSKQS